MLFNIGCKSDFEKLRASSDTDKVYKAAMEYYEKKEYLKAQTLFETVRSNLRGKNELEKVFFYYANTHYYLGNYTLAAYYFDQFSQTFANSTYREEADFMSAYSNYQLSPSSDLDQANTLKAIEGFQLFVNTYPKSTRADECNKLIDQLREKLVAKAYNEGQLYFDLKHYEAAIQSFDNLLKEYPETKLAEKIRFMMIKSSYLWAENSIVDKKQDRFQIVVDKCNTFLNRYLETSYKKEITDVLNNSIRNIKIIQNGYQK
ncbi:MAG: outer membrane protein assembly factor BamD [Saprospiraceae bacterium]|nr:outer membrane protein assembly factor BamD [Saprospiraceae bacterium]